MKVLSSLLILFYIIKKIIRKTNPDSTTCRHVMVIYSSLFYPMSIEQFSNSTVVRMNSSDSINTSSGPLEIETHELTGCYVVVMIVEKADSKEIFMSHYDPNSIGKNSQLLANKINSVGDGKVVKAIILPYADYNLIDPTSDLTYYERTKERTESLVYVFKSRGIAFEIQQYGNSSYKSSYAMPCSISVRLMERGAYIFINGKKILEI